MIKIDTSTPFGARAAERLNTDRLAWLTTVGKDGECIMGEPFVFDKTNVEEFAKIF